MHCISLTGEGSQLSILREDEKGPEGNMSTNRFTHVSLFFSENAYGMMLDICIFLIGNARLKI